MKFEWTKTMTKRVITYSVAGVFILLAYFLFSNINKVTGFFSWVASVLRPFILAFIFAYLLNGVLAFFEKVFGKIGNRNIRRILAIVVTWIVTIAVLALFFYIIIPDIKASIGTLINNIPGYLESTKSFANYLVDTYGIDENVIAPLLNFEVSTDNIMKIVEQYGKQLLPQIANIANISMKIGSTIFDIVIAIIISIYFMFSKETLIAQLKKSFYALFDKEVASTSVRVARETHRIFSGFINGKLLDSLIIGILCFIGMSILRFEYPLLISFIVGVTNIIPFFGPFIGAIPSVLLLLVINPWHALWFAVFVLGLQQLDGNVIGPKILGDSTGLPPIWVMFAILIGGEFMGVVGMFIGVPAFAVIYKFAKEILEKRLKKKNMPEETLAYKVIKGEKDKDDIELTE